jgi:hypothetical protein
MYVLELLKSIHASIRSIRPSIYIITAKIYKHTFKHVGLLWDVLASQNRFLKGDPQCFPT